MIHDRDSLSYNDCLGIAMRVRAPLHRISSKHGPYERTSASYFNLANKLLPSRDLNLFSSSIVFQVKRKKKRGGVRCGII